MPEPPHGATIALRCSAKDFETDSELQQLLSDLQRLFLTSEAPCITADDLPPSPRKLEATCAQCRRYSAKKKGVRRVSAVLPKWMVGKFLRPEFTRLQEKITLIHITLRRVFSPFPLFVPTDQIIV
jgi:hypothetical protein